jgi:SAM-dependent methyltransferase
MTPEELHNIYRAESDFWWYEGMRAITWALLDARLPRNLSRGLDAGCGTGMNALAFETRYGIRMHGIDLAPLGIEYSRQRGLARSAVASVLALPFGEKTFDLVISMDVLPVLRPGSDEQALSEFRRVLRPGGWLVLRVAAFRTLRSRHSQCIAEQHRYRAGELLRMLKLQDFSVLQWTYANFFLSPAAWFKFRIWEYLTRQEPQSGVAMSLPPWLNSLLLSALRSEAALIRSGARLPFGQSFMVLARKPL